jgi:hypothetical protein
MSQNPKPVRRTDWSFLRAVSRIDLGRPEVVGRIYEHLLHSLRDLGFQKVGIATYYSDLTFASALGDLGLTQGLDTFDWEVRRTRISKTETILKIPIHAGYMPPVTVVVLYNRIVNRLQFPSLISLIRILYYYLRCRGLEKTLEGKELFLSAMAKQHFGREGHVG